MKSALGKGTKRVVVDMVMVVVVVMVMHMVVVIVIVVDKEATCHGVEE
jgi:hypothetical protein